MLVILPFWTSILIRSYAWIFILGGRGIPQLLDFTGIEGVRLINPVLASSSWPEFLGKAPKLNLGYASLIAAHTLFTMSLVIVIVRSKIAALDSALLEASSDLYATPWNTFWSIIFPHILPAILAGFLLSFTFSFDDFIIAFFVAGSETTLPVYVFSSIRRGVTPEIDAIGTLVLASSFTLLVIALFLLRAKERWAVT